MRRVSVLSVEERKVEKMNLTRAWSHAHRYLVSNPKRKRAEKRMAAKSARRNAKVSLTRHGEVCRSYRPDSRDVV